MDFGTVIWIIVLVIAPIAAVLFTGAFGLLDQLGRGGLAIDESSRPAPRGPAGPVRRGRSRAPSARPRSASSYRPATTGGPPGARSRVDVEAEVQRLLALDPVADPSAAPGDEPPGRRTADEVRQLVIARNERRAARGEAPVDVEAEVERQMEDLNGT